MTLSLRQSVLVWLEETFPERQIYIRSEGRVQFFSFSPALQGILALSGVLFLSWVAFASVNVLFKDRIIAAKETHFRQLQATYETRVANLQLSYDEANTALVAAEDRFSDKAQTLETKQNAILMFLGRKRALDSALSEAARPVDSAPRLQEPSVGAESPPAQPLSQPTSLTKPNKIRHASFLDWGGSVDRLAGTFFGKNHRALTARRDNPHAPTLKRLALQTDRVQRIGTGEAALMTAAGEETAKSVRQIETLLHRAGVEPARLANQAAARHGMGGPEIVLDQNEAMTSDPAFSQAYRRAGSTLVELDRLFAGLQRVPLTTPVAGPQFDYSSGFGGRTDPITGRYAFHPGLDFSGPYGSVVRATASGVVVNAHYDGDYGNIVEINHGGGIHTRYGHLSAFLVKPGMRVSKGMPVGRLGSTGRSTGPHVHYEVWYDGMLRNPRNFIEAGRYVLKQG